MKSFVLGLILVAVGFVAGLLYGDRDNASPSVDRAAAHLDMERLRDSVNHVIATNVRTDTVEVPGEPTVRIIKQPVTIVDTISLDHYDTIQPPPETVMVAYSPWLVWEFEEVRPAATLTGSAHTNLLNPALSYLDYKLKINKKDICPPRYRLEVGGGFSDGKAFAAALIRVKSRLRVGPTYGVSGGRWGGLAMWGVR